MKLKEQEGEVGRWEKEGEKEDERERGEGGGER